MKKRRRIKVEKETRVNFNKCNTEALRSFPEGLRVGGDLNLHGCAKLEVLPEDLSVINYLVLTRCKNLKILPSGLRVGGNLWIIGCENLNDLPCDLQVAGTIYYNEDTGFAQDKKKLQELEMRFPEKLKRW